MVWAVVPPPVFTPCPMALCPTSSAIDYAGAVSASTQAVVDDVGSRGRGREETAAATDVIVAAGVGRARRGSVAFCFSLVTQKIGLNSNSMLDSLNSRGSLDWPRADTSGVPGPTRKTSRCSQRSVRGRCQE